MTKYVAKTVLNTQQGKLPLTDLFENVPNYFAHLFFYINFSTPHKILPHLS